MYFAAMVRKQLGGLGSLVGIRIRNSEDFPKVPDQAVRTLRMRSSSSNWTHPLSTFACPSCRRVRICRNSLISWKLSLELELGWPGRWHDPAPYLGVLFNQLKRGYSSP